MSCIVSCRTVPGESLLNQSDPHLVRVYGPGAPRQQCVGTDWEVVVDVDVVPATETPEPAVKHAVVLSRTDTIRVVRQDLHAVSNKAVLGSTIQLLPYTTRALYQLFTTTLRATTINN